MNDNTNVMDDIDTDLDTDNVETSETVNETMEEIETIETSDTESAEDVSATDSLTVADTPVTECMFTDTNIVAKMDIIIMLLLVMIAIKMFSPLANNHKRLVEKKEK